MQEMIESGLLMAVAALSVILLLIGQRPSSGMTKKQKIMLGRILTATVLLRALQTLGVGFFDRLGTAGRWVRLGFYLADYLLIGSVFSTQDFQGSLHVLVFADTLLSG